MSVYVCREKGKSHLTISFIEFGGTHRAGRSVSGLCSLNGRLTCLLNTRLDNTILHISARHIAVYGSGYERGSLAFCKMGTQGSRLLHHFSTPCQTAVNVCHFHTASLQLTIERWKHSTLILCINFSKQGNISLYVQRQGLHTFQVILHIVDQLLRLVGIWVVVA